MWVEGAVLPLIRQLGALLLSAQATTYAANNTGIAKKLGTFGDRAAQGLGDLMDKIR